MVRKGDLGVGSDGHGGVYVEGPEMTNSLVSLLKARFLNSGSTNFLTTVY